MGLTDEGSDSMSLPPVPRTKGMEAEGKSAAMEFCTTEERYNRWELPPHEHDLAVGMPLLRWDEDDAEGMFSAGCTV